MSRTETTVRRGPRRLAAVAATLVLGVGVGTGATLAAVRATDSPTRPEANSASPIAASSVLTVGQIYEKASDGVVEITASGVASNAAGPFGPAQEGEATGSGFVLDKEGHIVTNAHVVDGASSISVRFADGDEAAATLVGSDPSTDLAVLDVDVPTADLTPLSLGDEASVEVGDAVVAIGSPFGLDGSVTTGIVSALDRTIEAPNGYAIDGAIQTDAAINHGNSGGPLLDASGNVIGVNAQIASESGGNDGVGFAIGADTVKDVCAGPCRRPGGQPRLPRRLARGRCRGAPGHGGQRREPRRQGGHPGRRPDRRDRRQVRRLWRRPPRGDRRPRPRDARHGDRPARRGASAARGHARHAAGVTRGAPPAGTSPAGGVRPKAGVWLKSRHRPSPKRQLRRRRRHLQGSAPPQAGISGGNPLLPIPASRDTFSVLRVRRRRRQREVFPRGRCAPR